MVLLALKDTLTFRFQTGAIKSLGISQEVFVQMLFRFQTGAIKSSPCFQI